MGNIFDAMLIIMIAILSIAWIPFFMRSRVRIDGVEVVAVLTGVLIIGAAAVLGECRI